MFIECTIIIYNPLSSHMTIQFEYGSLNSAYHHGTDDKFFLWFNMGRVLISIRYEKDMVVRKLYLRFKSIYSDRTTYRDPDL